MREIDGVGDPVEERGGAVFEQGHHLGVDRPEDDQSSAHLLGLGGQPIYAGLQVGTKLLVALAVEVLELIQDQDVAAFRHRLQQFRELEKVIGSRIAVQRHFEAFQGVVHRREDACGLGIRHLHVEDRLLAADFLNCLLDQGRLADSTATADFGKKPALAAEHPLQVCKLFSTTVEFPVRHGVPLR